MPRVNRYGRRGIQMRMRAGTARSKYNRRTAYNVMRNRSKAYASRIADKKINTVVEQRMIEEIKKQEDETTTWLLSRVEHLLDDNTLTNQQKSPEISKMIKLNNNVDYWVDLTQLPAGNPNEPEGMDIGLYKIKQIQSRLRFYVNGIMPVHIVAQIIKINNSGRYGVGDQAGTNADITPNTHMLPDTNLRYAGIHKIEKKDYVPPGSQGCQVVDRKTWVQYPTSMNYMYNSTTSLSISRQVYSEKQIYLGKKYKRHARLVQVLNQETADNFLTDDRNKAKFIGDRFFLQIVANYQQGFNADTMANTASSSNVYFYGVSGCVYNFDKKPLQISVPLPPAQTIDNLTYDE